jgi:hypothetical protein
LLYKGNSHIVSKTVAFLTQRQILISIIIVEMSRINLVKNNIINNGIYNKSVYNSSQSVTSKIKELENITGLISKESDTTRINGSLVVDELLVKRFVLLKNDELKFSTIQGQNIACSSIGKYVSVCSTGLVSVSSDYGMNYTNVTFPDYSNTAICMSSTGDVQCMVSNSTIGGVSVAHISNDYGSTWNNRVLNNLSLSSCSFCAVSPNGKYVVCCSTTYISVSNNYGYTFDTISTLECLSCVVNDLGNAILRSSSSCSKLDLETKIVNLLYSIPNAENNLSLSSESNERYFLCTSLLLLYINKLSGPEQITKTIPEVFIGIIQLGSMIYGVSEKGVWKSKDYGSNWEIIYSGSVRSITTSSDGENFYILNPNGEIISNRLLKAVESLIIPESYKAKSTSNTKFSVLGTPVTGVSITLPMGVWSISFGWGFYTTSNVGDGINKNVLYGLSKSATGFELISLNRKFSITFSDQSTWETYADNVVIVLLKTTVIYLNARYTNPAPSQTSMTNCYINSTLIGKINQYTQ